MTSTRELRQMIATLELKSHVSAAQVGRATRSSDDDIGGKRPPGGITQLTKNGRQIYPDDMQEDYLLKSADYFKKQMQICHTDEGIARLIDEIKTVLQAWQRMPLPVGQPPLRDDPQWKRYIAESDEDAGKLATRYFLTRRRINQIRAEYREAA